MQSIATKNRINQITLIIFVSYLFYQLSDWVGGFWVPLSAIVIATPFSTFLTLQKARNRFLGTIAGLFLAILLQYYLRIFPEQLPVAVIVVAFVLGFVMTKDYKYNIAIITLAVCLTFSYMNAPFTSFEPSSLFLARLMGVFGAVFIYFFLQTFIFGKSNARLELQEEAANLCALIQNKYTVLMRNSTPEAAFNTAIEINDAGKVLAQLVEASTLVFKSNDKAIECSSTVLGIQQSIVDALLDFNPDDQSRLQSEMKRLSLAVTS